MMKGGGERVDVAVAIILRADGRFLLARRPDGKPYAGYWEFPGGKVEPGESVPQALARELREELGLTVTRAYPWVTQVFDYPHATVKLHFFRVAGWQGIPQPREGQRLAWERAPAVSVAPVLPANGPILRGLSLAPVMGITQAADLGHEVFLARARAALERGLRLIQVREKGLGAEALLEFTRTLVALARPFGARVILNATPELAHAAGADGVHLSSERLRALRERPDLPWCGASCHDRAELDHAALLGLDYAVVSPVLPTASHPGAATLGWDGFAALIRDCALPVYALGGMSEALLEEAWTHGAHGVAMLRGAW